VKTAGVASDAGAVPGAADPLVQDSETVTDSVLWSEKLLFTLNVALFSEFTIVQDAEPPTLIGTLVHPAWLTVYPAGAVSVAVQVAPTLKPVTVVVNGEASDAGPEAVVGVPLVQTTVTGTLAPLSGTKSLLTVNVALFSEFTIVQDAEPPTLIGTLAHAAWLTVYPAGAVSVAVHVAPAPKPVTVVVNGEASDAGPDAGVSVPLVQVTLTGTLALSFGMKSLLTVNVALFNEFTIVQPPEPAGAPVIEPVHGPLDVYPFGTGDSVAVQVAPGA